MTGYGPINDSLARRNIAPDPTCQMCDAGVRETVDHMLWECERYDEARYPDLCVTREHSEQISNESKFRDFNTYAGTMFEIRTAHLERMEV